jgi:hypothetical protein
MYANNLKQKNISKHKMNDAERINFIILALKSNKNQIGLRLGDKNGMRLTHVTSGRNKISDALARDISNVFPEIDYNWLLTGEGDPPKIRPLSKAKEPNATPLHNPDDDADEYEEILTKNGNKHSLISPGNYRLSVKLVEPRAFAGYLTGYSDPEYIEDLPEIEIFVKEVHRGIYRAFRVKGESMEGRTKRAIYDGDVVVGRSLERVLWKSRLHIQDRLEWVIVHSGGIVVKHISHHDVETGIITCVSYNEDKIVYPDFKLHLDDVYELYGIVKSINER